MQQPPVINIRTNPFFLIQNYFLKKLLFGRYQEEAAAATRNFEAMANYREHFPNG